MTQQQRRPTTDKGHVMGKVVDLIPFMTPTQTARARATSKSMSQRRHPAQQQARALRQNVRIPAGVIAEFGLDDLVSSCPQIPLTVYEQQVLPVSAKFRANGNYAIRTPDGGKGVCRLADALFGRGGCVRYIIYNDVLEVHVWCRGVAGHAQEKHCLFSARFYNDVAEYTATFFDASSKKNMPYTPRRVRYAGGDEEEAVLLANLLRAAVRIQKTGREIPMQQQRAEWTNDYFIYPVPHHQPIGC